MSVHRSGTRPLVAHDFPNSEEYLKALFDRPVLWGVEEPIDTREMIAHAAKIPNADLEVATLDLKKAPGKGINPDNVFKFECVILSDSAARLAQDWYLLQGLWPFAGNEVIWNGQKTWLMRGYPQRGLDHPTAQVNIDRTLAAFGEESGAQSPEATTSTQS